MYKTNSSENIFFTIKVKTWRNLIRFIANDFKIAFITSIFHKRNCDLILFIYFVQLLKKKAATIRNEDTKQNKDDFLLLRIEIFIQKTKNEKSNQWNEIFPFKETSLKKIVRRTQFWKTNLELNEKFLQFLLVFFWASAITRNYFSFIPTPANHHNTILSLKNDLKNSDENSNLEIYNVFCYKGWEKN